LGLPTYYGKFLPHVFSFCPHVYRLLGKDIPLELGCSRKEVFQGSEGPDDIIAIRSHYNPKLKLVLPCGAFAYGVRDVLAHKVPENSERHIRYAVLIEKNYSHLEQEGLACIFGNKEFNLCQEAALTSFA